MNRKNLGVNNYCFELTKKLVFTSANEGLAEVYVPVEKNLFPVTAVDCCLRKWKKMVSTSQKISFHWLIHVFPSKLASTSFIDGFQLKEKPLNKQFPIAAKSVSASRNEGFCWRKNGFH